MQAVKLVSESISYRAFLDALASPDLKLSVSESVINVFRIFTASASTGLSDFFITGCS